MGKFEELGREIGALVDKKNAAYGDSFSKSGEVLRLLFGQTKEAGLGGATQALLVDNYGRQLFLARVIDKLFRLATDPTAFDEDPIRDIAGYCLLEIERNRPAAKPATPPQPAPFDFQKMLEEVQKTPHWEPTAPLAPRDCERCGSRYYGNHCWSCSIKYTYVGDTK